jgi:hypothetical protein
MPRSSRDRPTERHGNVIGRKSPGHAGILRTADGFHEGKIRRIGLRMARENRGSRPRREIILVHTIATYADCADKNTVAVKTKRTRENGDPIGEIRIRWECNTRLYRDPGGLQWLPSKPVNLSCSPLNGPCGLPSIPGG